MTPISEWDQWGTSWREAGSTPAELERMIERTSGARRAIAVERALSGAVAVAALTVVGLALRHAANRFEAGLGLAVAAGITAAWSVGDMNRRRAAEKLEAIPDEYLAARRALCLGRLRFVRLSWVVVALDLVFLFPWWMGGFKVHGSGFHASQILSIWGPLAAMTGFIVWTIRLRRVARAELRQLGQSMDATSEG